MSKLMNIHEEAKEYKAPCINTAKQSHKPGLLEMKQPIRNSEVINFQAWILFQLRYSKCVGKTLLLEIRKLRTSILEQGRIATEMERIHDCHYSQDGRQTDRSYFL